MAKRKIEVRLTKEQKRRNERILAHLEAEQQRLFEETRRLQRRFRENAKRRRKSN